MGALPLDLVQTSGYGEVDFFGRLFGVYISDFDVMIGQPIDQRLRRTLVLIKKLLDGILDVLWADRILCTPEALKNLEETLGR